MAYDIAPSPNGAGMQGASMPLGNMPMNGNQLAGMGQPMAMPAPKPPLPEKLAALLASSNIVEDLDDDDIGNIAHKVIEEYDIDKNSRKEWETRNKAALDLAMMVAEGKNYPFEGASNIKFPLLTTAALQFNARAYPAIVQGNRVAKCQTWGGDPDGEKRLRADRVSEHLSYQLLSEDDEWEEDTDKLLTMLPIVGCAFRKVYRDPSIKRNATRLVTADRLVINYNARSVAAAPRLTEEMRLYPYEIQERIRSGRFIAFDYETAASNEGDDDKKDKIDQNDADAPHLFLEQHRLLDLDGDNYPEPYVVTLHHSSQKVCRIVANFREESVTIADDGKVAAIRRTEYYVKYPFLPSPDGGIYGMGFGWYLKDISELINSTLNQLMDAGHLANLQGGLVSSQVSGLTGKEKAIKLKMGEFRVVNGPVRDAMMPITFPGPNAQLFNLLGFLIETGKELASVKDVLTGDTPATAPVGTTLAMIEQGLQVFTAIYKRVHRAIKAELGLHARLSREFADDEKYAKFFDDGQPHSMAADYDEADMDIVPVSDPTQVSRLQQVAKAQLIGQWAAEPMANPVANQHMVSKRIFDAAQIENPEELINPPPQPNPEEEILKRKVAMTAIQDQEAEILVKKTQAYKNVADAEAKEAGADMQSYGMELDQINKGEDRALAAQGQQADQAGAEAERGLAEQGQQMDFANQGADRALQAEGMQMDQMNRDADREQAAQQAERAGPGGT